MMYRQKRPESQLRESHMDQFNGEDIDAKLSALALDSGDLVDDIEQADYLQQFRLEESLVDQVDALNTDTFGDDINAQTFGAVELGVNQNNDETFGGINLDNDWEAKQDSLVSQFNMELQNNKGSSRVEDQTASAFDYEELDAQMMSMIGSAMDDEDFSLASLRQSSQQPPISIVKQATTQVLTENKPEFISLEDFEAKMIGRAKEVLHVGHSESSDILADPAIINVSSTAPIDSSSSYHDSHHTNGVLVEQDISSSNSNSTQQSSTVVQQSSTVVQQQPIQILSNQNHNQAKISPPVLPVPSLPLPSELPITTSNLSHPSGYVPYRVPMPKQRYKYMKKFEIESVIRHQLHQLQTKNPLTDDYYYQVFNARRGGKYQGFGFPSLQPKAQPSNRNVDGTPILPEGTLGRIRASNVWKPKQLLNFADATTTQYNNHGEEVNECMFSSRSLDYLIEEGYRWLMDVEDINSLILALTPSEQVVHPLDPRVAQMAQALEQREELYRRLCESFDLYSDSLSDLESLRYITNEHLLFKFAPITKGRRLTFRSILLLPENHCFDIIFAICSYPLHFGEPVNYETFDDHGCTTIGSALYRFTPANLNLCFEGFVTGGVGLSTLYGYSEENRIRWSRQLIYITQTKLGSVLLQTFLKRGQEIKKFVADAEQPTDTAKYLHTWSAVYTKFCTLLTGRLHEMFNRLPSTQQVQTPAHNTVVDVRTTLEQQCIEIDEAESRTTPQINSKDKTLHLASTDSLWAALAGLVAHAQSHQKTSLYDDLSSLLHCGQSHPHPAVNYILNILSQ